MAITSLKKFASRFAGGKPVSWGNAVVPGANANTNIAVAGIKPGDVIVNCVELAGPGEAAGQAAATDRTAQTSITSTGNIQVTVATNTSADRRLLVQWLST